MTRTLLPVFLKLDGRLVLVVGGGPVARAKIATLLDRGARVRVVAPDVIDEIRALAGDRVEILARAFEPRDLLGAWLVVAAATSAVNGAVAQAAEDAQVFVNAVDDSDHASAYLGATFERGGVTIAIGTAGAAPALAGLLREGIEDLLPPDLDGWVRQAGDLRREWKRAALPHGDRRLALLRALMKRYELENT